MAAHATQQRVQATEQLHARLRAVESAAAAEERQHREECRAGQLRIVALQKALKDAQAAHAHERAQLAQQQRAAASQLQECRSCEVGPPPGTLLALTLTLTRTRTLTRPACAQRSRSSARR